MTFGDDALDRLAPATTWHADWSDVLRRAGERDAVRVGPRRFRRRRWVVGLAVLAAVLIPLAAVAATNDWWFFKSGNAPRPVHQPVVVKEGAWGGLPWQLVAYPSGTDGLCVSVSPRGSTSGVGAMGCGPFVGVSRTAHTKDTPDMTITYLAGSGPTGLLPTYIVGPVIEKAVEVEIQFTRGKDIHVPTFGAPAPLRHIRFYATQIPDSAGSLPPTLKWLAGRDKDGRIVACLAPATAKEGISPLSDCR